ncbi:MAG: hypothetical protein AMXMBFR7_08900 [Planctomycetota bacterium]
MRTILGLAAVLSLAAGAEEAGAVRAANLEYVTPKLPPKPERLPLEEQTGHPRIMIPDGGLKELTERGKTTHQAIAAAIVKQAEEMLEEAPEASPRNAEGPMRRAVRKPAQLAWAYAATGEAKYRAAAIQYAEVVCAYPHWDIDVDLAAGHGLWAIALAYDWFHADLSDAQKKLFREKVKLQGERMAKVWGAEKVKGGTWWTRELLQNHGQVNSAGLAAAAIVFYHELPEAKRWLELANGHFEQVFAIVNEDGSSMEGINYWGYSMEHMMLYAELARRNLGRDFFATSGYLRNSGRFLAAHLTPWFRAGDFVFPYGAAAISTGTHGPAHILFKSAAATRDPLVQDLAWSMIENDSGKHSPLLPLALLWCDASVARGKRTEFPAFAAFPELGIVTARSGWDEQATALWFKCGAYQGRTASEILKRNSGSGHARPDQTAFQFVSRGERLTAYGNARCENHNLPIFRGLGQFGEHGDPEREGGLVVSEAFTAPEQPKLLRAEDGPRHSYAAGDASKIYKLEAGVKIYRRHLVFLKPDGLLVVDEIELGAGKPAAQAPDVAWNLNVLGDPAKKSARHYRVDGKQGGMDVMLCAPAEGFAFETPEVKPNTGYMVPEVFHLRKRLALVSQEPVKRTVLAVYLHARGATEASPAAPRVTLTDGKLTAEIGSRTVALNLAEAACSVK